jgi:hypothetical protein
MVSLVTRAGKGIRRRLAHSENNRRLKALAGEINRRMPAPSDRPVVFFNASTRLSGLSLNAAYSLLASWSLRLTGTPVVHFVCSRGLAPCVLGTDRYEPTADPPCKECIQQSEVLFDEAPVWWFDYRPDQSITQLLEGRSINQLERFEYGGAALGKLVLPSLRWILRRHHLQDDENTRTLWRQYITSAWSLMQQFSQLLDEVQPQAVVVFNGMFYPEAAAKLIAQRRGIRVISHEVGLRPFSAFFTTGDATAYPIDIADDFELTETQNQRLDQYLEQRFQGNFSMAGIRFWPEMRSLDPEFLERAGSFKQIVPVFTNVIFDTSQGQANVLFPHMFAWLDQVLEVIQAHPETFFVIRAHPDETRPGKKSRESVYDWVRQNNVAGLPNVQFVGSEEFFSSYELIQKSKFVMVYNSTIGLEASILGSPVLCGGKARFTQIPTVFFPASATAYRAQTEEFLTADSIEIPTELARNARRFLYYQLFKSSLPFDAFLEEDPVWSGYVRVKPLAWDAFLPEKSATLTTIVKGIRDERPFYLEDQDS